MTNLEQLAVEYARLNEMKKQLDVRLDELNKQLKDTLDEGTHKFGDFELTVQVKDRTTLDEEAALALFLNKPVGVYEFCTERRISVNPEYVEQAYLNGMLTDSDLRAIRKPQYSVALIAKRVERDNVQSHS